MTYLTDLTCWSCETPIEPGAPLRHGYWLGVSREFLHDGECWDHFVDECEQFARWQGAGA